MQYKKYDLHKLRKNVYKFTSFFCLIQPRRKSVTNKDIHYYIILLDSVISNIIFKLFVKLNMKQNIHACANVENKKTFFRGGQGVVAVFLESGRVDVLNTNGFCD